MKRICLISVYLVLTLINFANVPFLITLRAQGTEQYLLWGENVKLTWNDFNKVDFVSSGHSAETWTIIKRNQIALYQDSMILTVGTYFLRDSSKVEEDSMTPRLLKHEQIHWDIAELFARKVRASYKEHVSSNIKASYKFFNDEYNKIMQLKDEFQQLYDIETDYSRNQEMQEVWADKVKKMLNETRHHADVRVVIRRRKE